MASRGESLLQAVREYADNVLRHGKDRYGSDATPLFADGLNVRTGEHVRWKSDGQEWILSNLANQQHLFRTLSGLSRLTGEGRYREAADQALSYAFRELRYGGLLCWGGHMAFDLAGKKQVYASDKGPQHELKCHFPYYEWMYEVNPAATRSYIEALWDSHITDWSNLEFSRHGKPKTPPEGGVWSREYAGGDVFFEGQGLTFINAGSDLVYAASQLYRFGGDDKPLQWAKRLARRYVETRNSNTGLGGYQFSISILPGPRGRGDRAIEQFGEQLRREQPIEAKLTSVGQLRTILGPAALCKLTLAETLGEAGREFGQWAAEDLIAYAAHAYDMHDNTFHPILTSGVRLTGITMEKDGYYGRRGDVFKPVHGDALLFWSYVRGFRFTAQPLLWSVARNIGLHLGLGDIGAVPGAAPALEAVSGLLDPHAILALLELYRWSGTEPYLDAAERFGMNLLRSSFRDGYFHRSAESENVKLDCPEALILLQLAAALSGRAEEVPAYVGGQSFFGAAYDGHGHQIDNSLLYR
ncbi:hypothetical protein ACFQI7_06605 [Paenibacillus allorhizosphaerae]|uniref:Pectate disaccharide-lyase n=1 Tax=Paenibacillus allorhizosphaerae TaxID=2849866 RepID=A0ABM8VFM4_9BACL|nr:hypothetical protein [Paenibacillus allorhizosphaerae]CAG7635425.1 Pectate disaccharide-lyase [Paenibacillus allorhizosphaerae]